VKYGLEVVSTTMKFALQKWGLAHYALFNPAGRKLETGGSPYYARGAVEGQASV
jgi:hypothetical protein